MKQLIDSYGRHLKYLRISVTDRCNLRCTYCMPEEMGFLDSSNLMSAREIVRLVRLFADLGIDKLRFTGGEPFVRKDFMDIVAEISQITSIKEIGITSNLTLIHHHIDDLERVGVKNVNISLDAYDPDTFYKVTRRDSFNLVKSNLNTLIERGFNLKVNCVVMKGVNEDQIFPLLELARMHPVSVRFLEEMPFNGLGVGKKDFVDYQQILAQVAETYPYTKLIDGNSSTSLNYQIDGFKGTFGVIPSFSRTFCGQCDRLRVSMSGSLRTCLYGKEQLNLLQSIRGGDSDDQIRRRLFDVVARKEKDGFEATDNNNNKYQSMTKLGG